MSHDHISSSQYPMIIYSHPVTCNLQIKLKLWLLGDCKWTHSHVHAHHTHVYCTIHIPFDRIICRRLLGLVRDILALISLRIWNMCNGWVWPLIRRLLYSPLDTNPKNTIHHSNIWKTDWPPPLEKSFDTTCTTYLPATDMFLSIISLTRLLSKVRNVWCGIPAYGMHCTGRAYGFWFLSSGLIIMTSTWVAATQRWRVDCFINSVKRERSLVSLLAIFSPASCSACILERKVDISARNCLPSLTSRSSSSTVHPSVYIAWRVDFPSRTWEEYLSFTFTKAAYTRQNTVTDCQE